MILVMAGSFSGGVPAVLGTTLDVTYGAGGEPTGPIAEPIVVQASNEVIRATTLVFDPMELLDTDGSSGTSQFKVHGDGGAAIIDSTETAGDPKLPPKECH